GTEHDDRYLVLAMVLEDELLGLDLALSVAVHVQGRDWVALVGAMMMASGVNAERAEVHESLQRALPAGVEEQAESFDIDGAIFLDRPPVAHLGRAVDDHLDVLHGLADHFGVGQVPSVDPHAESF